MSAFIPWSELKGPFRYDGAWHNRLPMCYLLDGCPCEYFCGPIQCFVHGDENGDWWVNLTVWFPSPARRRRWLEMTFEEQTAWRHCRWCPHTHKQDLPKRDPMKGAGDPVGDGLSAADAMWESEELFGASKAQSRLKRQLKAKWQQKRMRAKRKQRAWKALPPVDEPSRAKMTSRAADQLDKPITTPMPNAEPAEIKLGYRSIVNILDDLKANQNPMPFSDNEGKSRRPISTPMRSLSRPRRSPCASTIRSRMRPSLSTGPRATDSHVVSCSAW